MAKPFAATCQHIRIRKEREDDWFTLVTCLDCGHTWKEAPL